MLPLRKKISDLKSRPLNWDRVSYVLSKIEYFLSTWGDVMSRKTDPKKSECGGILTTKRSNFERCHKSDKKNDCIKAKKGQKIALFGDQKKRNQIEVSYRSTSGGGRPAAGL